MTEVTLQVVQNAPVIDIAGPGAALAAHYASVASGHADDAETAKVAAEDAQEAAEAARDEALDAAFNLNTRFAETSRQNLVLSDSNGLNVPGRTAPIGAAFTADFSGPIYTHGLSEITFLPTLEFARAGTGVAIGGADSETFAEDVPRILDGRLFLDGGGTNLIDAPSDFSNAGWTKTNLGTPTAADGPSGTGAAWQMLETTTSGNHNIVQVKTGLTALTQATVCALVKAVGRDYLQLDFYNSDLSQGVRARFSLLSGGSVLSSYPAGLGSGAASVTNKNAGIVDYGGGFWLIWITGTMSVSTTTLRPYLYLMSGSSTVSYAGDTAKGMIVQGLWGIAGSGSPVNFLTGTRAAETFEVPLGEGYYATQIEDGRGEVNDALAVTTLGQRWAPVPRTGGFWINRASAYVLSLYDTMTRADTSAGDLGTATDGNTYSPLQNPGSFPMVAATNGYILNNAFQFTPYISTDPRCAVYVPFDMGPGTICRYISAEIAWDSDSGSSGNTTAALLTSNSLTNLTERMPVHIVITRSGASIQYRGDGGSFTVIGVVKPLLGSSAKDGTWTQAIFAIQGNKMKVTWGGVSTVVQNDILLELARYGAVELISQFPTGSNTDRVKMRNVRMSVAEVGEPLTYTATAPVNVALPFAAGTAVAGNTYTASSSQGGWTSNNGNITYTYQWQFNGVDIPGATNSSLVTVDGVDEGKTVSVKVTATNASGSTTATSLPSAALA